MNYISLKKPDTWSGNHTGQHLTCPHSVPVLTKNFTFLLVGWYWWGGRFLEIPLRCFKWQIIFTEFIPSQWLSGKDNCAELLPSSRGMVTLPAIQWLLCDVGQELSPKYQPIWKIPAAPGPLQLSCKLIVESKSQVWVIFLPGVSDLDPGFSFMCSLLFVTLLWCVFSERLSYGVSLGCPPVSPP